MAAVSGTQFLGDHVDVIFKDFDKKEAETKEKHFVIVSCADAKRYTGNIPGKAYQFSFHKLNSPVLRKLDFEAQEAILDTKLNNDVCFLFINGKTQPTMIVYKRGKANNKQ